MQPTQATTWITKARFAPYLEEAGGEHEKALALYIWNARISAAAFEALHHVEMILRNAVDVEGRARGRHLDRRLTAPTPTIPGLASSSTVLLISSDRA